MAGAAPPTVDTTIEVWVSGLDMLVVEQGPVAAEGTADTTSGRTVELGALGQGTLVLGAGGNVVVAHPDEGRFVRVTATRSEADLVLLAGGLSRR